MESAMLHTHGMTCLHAIRPHRRSWEPKVKLRDGLALMVDDFRQRLHVDE